MPHDNVREVVTTGPSLPQQDLRVPVRHALVDLGTDLKAECEARHIAYSTASKALSGHHGVTDATADLFQEILHRWKPGSFQPAPGQEDQITKDPQSLDEIRDMNAPSSAPTPPAETGVVEDPGPADTNK